MSNSRSTEIRDEIKKSIFDHLGTIHAEEIADKYHVSSQAIYKHVKYLMDHHAISRTRSGQKYLYTLLPLHQFAKKYALHGLQEDIVLSKDLKSVVSNYMENNAFQNYSYVFTEMLNNAIEHSEGSEVIIGCTVTDFAVTTTIDDNGIGIFHKIQNSMGLDDAKHSVLELAKGKFTTDPSNHTGEGIFFSSKIADEFYIFSNDIAFSSRVDENEQYLFDLKTSENGTIVYFTVIRNTKIISSDVFREFTEHPDDFGFIKTTVPVYLLEYDESNPTYVSRSQAKRLLARFDRFRSVILDFVNVPSIGQGFADEIFRVFVNTHPECKITYQNAAKPVEAMIRHVSASFR